MNCSGQISFVQASPISTGNIYTMLLKNYRPDSALNKGKNRPAALPDDIETVAIYVMEKLMEEETRGVNRR